ncbi:MAG TPA: nuclear transport factor 2 family protein [Xenococcaceae cyanobacterium]|jgi:uncharacterized protein (TIGR02246 family)
MNRQEIETLVRRQARAWEKGDVATIVADFAEDGLLITAGKKSQGKEAIATTVKDYFAQFSEIKIEIKRILVEGDSGAVEWNWRETKRQTNITSYAEDAIIFQLKNQKITYWREYIEQVV